VNNTGYGERVRKSSRGDYIDESTRYLQVKYQSKTPLNNEKTLNNEGKECKSGSY
jgi:hypothetical protein